MAYESWSLTRVVARTASTVCGKEPRCNKASLQRTYFVSPSWPFVIWRLQRIIPVTMKQQTVLATWNWNWSVQFFVFHEEAPHTCEALARRIWVVLDMAGEAGGGMLCARQDSRCPIPWRLCSRNLRDHGKGASLFTFPCAIAFS